MPRKCRPLQIPRRVLGVVGLEFRARRGFHAGTVLQHEDHLLSQPASHDGVVAVETQALNFPIEDVLLYRVRRSRCRETSE
jgi:hypothetical protein